VKGFLGTWASFSADLNLLVQIAMGTVMSSLSRARGRLRQALAGPELKAGKKEIPGIKTVGGRSVP